MRKAAKFLAIAALLMVWPSIANAQQGNCAQCVDPETCEFGKSTGGCTCTFPNGTCETQCKCGLTTKPPCICEPSPVAKAIAKHKNLVLLVMSQSSYDAGGAKIWLDEAIKQGKFLRIIVAPSNMSEEQQAEFRETQRQAVRLFRLQELALDAVTTAP